MGISLTVTDLHRINLFTALFGAPTLPICSPVSTIGKIAGRGAVVYQLDFQALAGWQQERLVKWVAAERGIRYRDALEDIRVHGFAIAVEATEIRRDILSV